MIGLPTFFTHENARRFTRNRQGGIIEGILSVYDATTWQAADAVYFWTIGLLRKHHCCIGGDSRFTVTSNLTTHIGIRRLCKSTCFFAICTTNAKCRCWYRCNTVLTASIDHLYVVEGRHCTFFE